MKFFTALLSTSLAILLCSCSSFSSKNEQETKIAAILPLTGQRAFSGKKAKEGILLAYDQIKKRGPIRGKTIKLVIIDNKSTPKGNREAIKSLIGNDQPALIISDCNTAGALTIKPFAMKNKIPVLLTISTGNIATERNPYMFRCCFTDKEQAKAMAQFAVKSRKIKDMGIMLDLNERVTYRRDLGRAFAEEFKKLSGKRAHKVGYNSQSKNFTFKLKHFKHDASKAIFAPCDIPDAGLMIKQARDCGINKILLGSDGWDRPEIFKYSGGNIGECYISAMFSPDLNIPEVKHFVNSMKETTGQIPNADAAQAYDALNIAVKALKLAKNKNDIRSGLYQIKDLQGVTGKISINAEGDAKKPVFIKKIVKKANGELGFKLINIIYP